MKKKHGNRVWTYYPLKKTLRIMRLVLLFLLTSIFQTIASVGYSQSAKITLKSEALSLLDVLSRIEDQSEYRFIYDKSQIDLNKKVKINYDGATVKKVLEELFVSKGINYQMIDNQIILTGSASEALQQSKTVSGKVTDSSGAPLPGVSVVIKGTNTGIITDADGNYSLSNVPGDASLVFSFVGMKTQEITVAGKSVINVMVEENAIGLEEVVAVGYGTQKKVNLTGSLTQVTSDRLENRPISSVGEGLQGLIPNFNVTFSTGEPGESPDFNVRGFESINGGNPLILVDGVAMDINLVNPSDIESITVLKDASASSIYGARASFGVVLVTTKKGANKKTTFRYDFEYSLNAPIIKIKPVSNSYDYALVENERTINTLGTPFYTDIQMAGLKAYYDDPVNNPEWAIVDGEFQFYGYNNWRDILLKDISPSRKHNFSVSGGSEKLDYYISAGYLDKDGLYKVGDNDYYKRLNLHIKLNLQATKWLSFDYGVKYNNQKMDDPHIYEGNSEFTLDGIVRNHPDWPIQMPYHPDYAQYEGYYFLSSYAYFKEGGRDTDNTDDLWMTTGTEINLVKHLSLKADFSYNIFNRQLNEAAPKILFLNKTGMDSDNPFTYSHTAADYVSNDIWNNRYYAFNAFAEYENTFKGEHYLKVMAGFNQEYKKLEWNYSKGNELVSSENPTLNLTLGTSELDYSLDEWAIRGAFYRVNYIYKNRYLFELSGRYDATSRFPKSDRYNFFPSFSAGWRVSEENFMAGTRAFIDNLKFRASYGTLGNQLLDNNYYPYIANLGYSQAQFVMNGNERTPVFTPAGLVSPTLTWETVSTKNIGIDLTILKQRLDFSFDYYTRCTKDMLMQKTYPDILGTGAPQENAADLKTKGWETIVTWRDKIGRDFKYDVQLSMADATSEITKYENPTGSLDEYYVGQKIGEIWGFETVGIFQDEEEIANAANQEEIGSNWAPGDIHYANLDNDNKISVGNRTLENPGDLKVIGNTIPRYSFGINLNVNYKAWFGGLFFQGIEKQDYWPEGRKFLPFSNSSGILEHHLDYWSEDNRDAYFFRPLTDTKNTQVQTRYLQDAAYIRLKNLTIGYNLPSEWTQKFYIENAKVFFSGQNLWEATKLRDPLLPEELTGEQKYPFQRVYSFGVNVIF